MLGIIPRIFLLLLYNPHQTRNGHFPTSVHWAERHYFFFFFDHQCSGGFKNNFCCCKTYQLKSDSLITIKAIRNRLMTRYWQYSQFEILLDWTWKTILAILSNLTRSKLLFERRRLCVRPSVWVSVFLQKKPFLLVAHIKKC